jgi:carboxymethylenebutenolidase
MSKTSQLERPFRLAGALALAASLSGCQANSALAVEPSRQCLAPTVSQAAPTAAQPAPEHVTLMSEGRKLQATLLRPSGPGPFPAIVYNHGSERDPIVAQHGNIGRFFQSHGYVVLFPNRRGAGGSEGTFWEDAVDKLPEAKQEEGVVAALDAESADVVAAVRYLQAQPYVERRDVSVAGCSFGGIESLLAATKPIGLHAVVDFAGGSMAWQGNGALRERMLRAAYDAQVPVLFAQAENDFDTTPSKVLSSAMLGVGKPTELHIYPPFGKTPAQGHGMFCMHGTNVWGDDVLAFLRKR